MTFRAPIWLSLLLPLATGRPAATPPRNAIDLLAKASAAFENNQLQVTHWNWVSTEKRAITDKAGKIVQQLPDVSIESVIRSDGRRCTAVLSWGDGVPAYEIDADPDTRCQATDSKEALDISALLKVRRAKLLSDTSTAIVISLSPDKEGLRSTAIEQRCASSIRATIRLDPATYFPIQVEGEVVETGCDVAHNASVYYEGPARQEWVRASIHKGTVFRYDYELQKDKFQTPEHNFWIAVHRRQNVVRWLQGGNFVSWGRRFPITPEGAPQHIVEDVVTTAQEFGAQSFIR